MKGKIGWKLGNSIFVYLVIFVAKIAFGIQTSLVIPLKTDKLMPC
jgi:hypothetical protein